jgi:DNA-nicking Smr family endonuclease
MRRPPADDIGLWRRAVRDVAPLPGRIAPERGPLARPQYNPSPHAGEGRGGIKTGERPAIRSAPRPVAEPLPPPGRFAGVDRATAERLKRGRTPVEASLDLHGMTQAEAHRALTSFIGGSRAAGRRCLLVITGHGRSSGGVLKAAVPRWLGEPELRHHVLALAPAQPKAGGSGALYVLLRRLPQTAA